MLGSQPIQERTCLQGKGVGKLVGRCASPEFVFDKAPRFRWPTGQSALEDGLLLSVKEWEQPPRTHVALFHHQPGPEVFPSVNQRIVKATTPMFFIEIGVGAKIVVFASEHLQFSVAGLPSPR